MTTGRKNLLKLLTFVQNNIKTPIDIMTITEFMDDDQLIKHIMCYVRELNADKRATLLEMAKNL